MAKVIPGRFSAQREGDFVVFLIGMRINSLLRVDKWLPTARAMGPMIKELSADPSSGFLSAQTFVSGRTVMLVQYWNSFEQLTAFARNADQTHLPAWRAFNKRIGTDGTVGIFHETYLVKAGQYETIYNNMPVVGLAGASEHVPVARRGESAAYRVGRAEVDAPVEPVPA